MKLMVKSIITFILTRFKMLLDRFIINTDYDSQKVSSVLELSLPIAEFNIGAHNTRAFNTTVLVDEGEYFENVFIINKELVGNYTMIGGNPTVHKSQYDVYFDVYRSDKTHYILAVVFVNQSNNTITIPTSTTKAKVHLLVAAKQ